MNRPPPFDARRAKALVGKRVLIGLTLVAPSGKVRGTKQLHGVVRMAHKERGIKVALGGARKGEFFWLPPDLRPFRKAEPGEYRLRSTGEVVVDPDLTCGWTINERAGPAA